MSYENRYVAFVDILGFRQLVDRTVSDPSSFDPLLNVLLEIAAYKPPLGDGTGDFLVTSFSDCIAISARANDTGLWSVILAAHALQFNLWRTGVLFRGAITKGDLYHNQQVLFGPAFNEAYRLETAVSVHPRIMLADDVYDDALISEDRGFLLYVSRYLLKLPYDVPCIDPFGDFEAFVTVSRSHAIQRLIQAKTIIEEKLREVSAKPELVAKWTWLARRYNGLITDGGYRQPPAIDTINY